MELFANCEVLRTVLISVTRAGGLSQSNASVGSRKQEEGEGDRASSEPSEPTKPADADTELLTLGATCSHCLRCHVNWMWCCMPLVSEPRRQRQEDLYPITANLVYLTITRIARAT